MTTDPDRHVSESFAEEALTEENVSAVSRMWKKLRSLYHRYQSVLWKKLRSLYHGYQSVLRWASAILIIVLIFMTAADIKGVSGDILLWIGISVFGLVTLSVWFRYAGLITGAGALATKSAGAKRLMGFLVSLSTIPVLWALLLWTIPFEDNPSSAARLLASVIGLVGVMAFPTEWLGNGRLIRFIKIVLVIGLVLAVILFGLAAFGITPDDIGNSARSSWDWTREQWSRLEEPVEEPIEEPVENPTEGSIVVTATFLESGAVCPESREIEMPRLARQTITVPPDGCPSDWYLIPTHYDQPLTWHIEPVGEVFLERVWEGHWSERPDDGGRELTLKKNDHIWRARWKSGSNIVVLVMEW